MSRITLRTATDADRAFLYDVYASTREEELAVVPWTDSQKQDFLAMQFNAQDVSYRTGHPADSFLVVERDGAPVGRLYRARIGVRELRIIDIALLSEHRGSGIGGELMRDLLAEADRDGLVVSLHVELWNRAYAWYERLGFHDVERGDAYVLMERNPRPDVS